MSLSRLSRCGFFLLLALSVSPLAFGALSSKYNEWRSGPVQWIMTSDEQKGWKALKSDEEASRFIDLFWARRDPTSGSPKNEYLEEFDQRVRYADEHFKEGRTRGSVTERGRVYIILGPPSNLADQEGHGSLQAESGGDLTNGHDLGARSTWLWGHDAAARYGMPRIEVVFVADVSTHAMHRDPLRADFLAAAPVAIRQSIVNPSLTEVPSWALSGGLEPKVTMVTPAEEPTVQTATVVFPDTGATSAEARPVSTVIVGASRLTLVREVSSIVTETDYDPFTRLIPVAAFHAQDNLGWVAQYCSGSSETPPVRFTVRLTGKAEGETINRAAEPEEILPDRVKAVPGCYLLRGEIPLEGMSNGSYQLEVRVEDVATSKGSTLKQAFKIE